jgi:hypothetical protein
LIDRLKVAVKRRRNFKDPFRDENGYSWDFFLAFRVYDETDPISELQMKYSMKALLDKLSNGGLEVRLFYSLQVSESRAYAHSLSHLSHLSLSTRKSSVNYAPHCNACRSTPI